MTPMAIAAPDVVLLEEINIVHGIWEVAIDLAILSPYKF